MGGFRQQDDRPGSRCTAISGGPRVGISRCLLGDPVRYDGAHRRDDALLDALGPHVRWVPVCPEAESGLPVPRVALDLCGDAESPHLVSKTGEDHTERMEGWIARRLPELGRESLCGFVFKCRSPSCGRHSVPVVDDCGTQRPVGVGMFARAFMARFPALPVADEEALRNPDARQEFMERVRRLNSEPDR